MKIYNTLTRKKEVFEPMDPLNVKIYVCGPTVYNYFHIGNARPFVVFDTLRRYMEYRGMKVNFVQNFTDVDDKIINKAREDGLPAGEVSEKYIEEYYKDAKALNVLKASTHPKVTENIDEIIDFVSLLIEKGFAYAVPANDQGQDVYFSTRKFNEYGKLSKQDIDELEVGARVMVEEVKKDPLDFALWKARKSEDEIAWECPWGMGRPGWHIECSAMACKYLGETIDIHAGGQDLTFPHHENEIAQSEAHNGCTFANYWMHNGYITIDNQKMSKSLNNFFTVRDILEKYDGEVIRYFLLSGHYRSPINFSDELMVQAKNSLQRIRNAKDHLEHILAQPADELKKLHFNPLTASEYSDYDNLQWGEELNRFKEDFIKAMEDDLNTADAITAIFELVSYANKETVENPDKNFARAALKLLFELSSVLGLLETEEDNAVDPEILSLIEQRVEARKNKDFAKADEIRDILAAKGITLMDTPQGIQIIKN
ncbi:MAG: cysteine--tRNA ligase [Anaerovoracaceae bacterium]